MKYIALSISALCFIYSTCLVAQETKETSKAPAPGSQQVAMMELAKASQNPIADMNSIPFQFNWYTGGGYGDQTMSQTLIQPVLPLPLNDKWNVVSRTIVPVMNVPVSDVERAKGIADIQEQVFFSPTRKQKLIFGFGPVFSFPTSTNAAWATGQFALGPAIVVLTMQGKWVIGAVANNLWRFAGSEVTTPISLFFVQPFINYNLKKGWAFGTAPSITANWSAESGQQWTVPLGLNVSKIAVVGKQPLSVNIQYYRNVARPDDAGSNQIRMSVSFLFPKQM
jgi:hypothetical protein